MYYSQIVKMDFLSYRAFPVYTSLRASLYTHLFAFCKYLIGFFWKYVFVLYKYMIHSIYFLFNFTYICLVIFPVLVHLKLL